MAFFSKYHYYKNVKQKIEFTIGEMSRLHNIPVKTLRYYDSVNLFKPSKINHKNSYRYYSIEQFELLNSIKFLRHMGFSIEDIKKHISKKSTASFMDSLQGYKKLNESEINRLEEINRSLEERIAELENFQGSSEFGKISIREFPDRNILYLDENVSDIVDLELNLRKLENRAGTGPSIIIGRVGLTISEENLKKGVFDNYNSIFILHNSSAENSYCRTLKGGEYVSVSVNSGDHTKSSEYYKKIFSFLEEKRYCICGDSIERVIIDYFITDNPDEFLTEIQIPVKADTFTRTTDF